MERLAINGGKPVRDTYLAYGRQCITEEDINEVNKVLRGDYLTTGPMVRNFEESVANYVGAKYAVAVTSGTAALHIACLAAGVKEGDEVLVPAITFVASSNCVLYCGGIPVFVDIDMNTGNIDVDKIEEKITSRTKAIIPVDFSGHSVHMDRIMEIACKYNLIVIEDGAHALGSEYKGEKVGSKAHMTEFSFHPVKPITTGEGGVVTTNSKELYEKLKLYRTHGITREENQLIDNHGPWYYEQQVLGYNYRIPDINCALGLSQMKKLDSFLEKRRSIAEKYNESFLDNQFLTISKEEQYSNSGWHIYVIKLNLDKLRVGRREIFQALQKENIGVNVHYLPVYLQPYYKKLGYNKGLCSIAEAYYDRILTLPLYPLMREKDVLDVIKAVDKVLNYYKKLW